MIDVDPMGRIDISLRGILHWLVVNIPGKNLNLGEVKTQ